VLAKRPGVIGDSSSSDRFEVLIVGGGVAGLEAALALRDLAGDRVNLRLSRPDPSSSTDR
jgi:succinate dehydrogenase/fumarate reductase flavoprotein subunit